MLYLPPAVPLAVLEEQPTSIPRTLLRRVVQICERKEVTELLAHRQADENLDDPNLS